MHQLNPLTRSQVDLTTPPARFIFSPVLRTPHTPPSPSSVGSRPQRRLLEEEHRLLVSIVIMLQRCGTPSGPQRRGNQSCGKHKQAAARARTQRTDAVLRSLLLRAPF